jgi:2-amino-4-hydroxy-6-hydroxymethyldihydropteridine diphosphokinase
LLTVYNVSNFGGLKHAYALYINAVQVLVTGPGSPRISGRQKAVSQERQLKGNYRQTRAYIGLGSNEGDRVGFVQQAMQLLKDIPRIKVIECSSLYETEPVTNADSEWFVNAVAAVDTNLAAHELLDVCKDIENRLNQLHGTEKRAKSGSTGLARIINLDILFFGQQVLETEYLRVPHPNVCQRAYALVPLLEIAPNLVHPCLQKTVTQLHEDLPDPELVYLYGTRGIERELE